MVFPILGSGKRDQYLIENSFRLVNNASSTQWLANEPTSSGSDMIATFSFWTKRGALDGNQYIWTSGWDNNNQTFIYLNANKLYYYNKASSSTTIEYTTNRLFRDTNAWYHIVIALKTTEASGDDGIKIYVNGVQETSFSSSTWTQNTTFTHGKAYGSLAHQQIGRRSQYTPSADRYYDGYIADWQYVNGLQLGPDAFGKFDVSGIWVPTTGPGARGTQGYKLEFKNAQVNHKITASGQTNHATAQKKIGSSSVYFDGSDALTIPADKSFHFGTGPYTIEMWVKHSGQGGNKYLLYNSTGPDNSTGMRLNLTSDDYVNMNEQVANGDIQTTGNVDTGDNAWHHIALSRPPGPYNSPTDDGLLEIYVDGTLDEKRGDNGYRNMDNRNDLIIGATAADGSNGYTGYIDEIRISNVARDLGDFSPSTSHFSDDANTVLLLQSNTTDGSTTFVDSSGSTYGIGADTGGGGYHWTSEQLVTSVAQTTDTPTNNFCTLNRLNGTESNASFAEGNLKFTNTLNSSPHHGLAYGSMAVTAGKWYWEVSVDAVGGTAMTIGAHEVSEFSKNDFVGNNGVGYFSNGNFHYRGSETGSLSTYTTGDIVGVALDMDNRKIYFHKNGSWENSGDPTSGATGTGAAGGTLHADNVTMCPAVANYNSGIQSCNFGNAPYVNAVHTGGSGYYNQDRADANGYGNFQYEPPSGYYALCRQNLAEFGG